MAVEIDNDHYKERRISELGGCSNELLRQVVERYNVLVTPLAGGERYSMIVAIVELEMMRGEQFLELSNRVEVLSEGPEIIALRSLSLLMMENKHLSERHRALLAAAHLPAYNAIVEKLEGEGFSKREISTAVLKRALRWG